MPDHGTAWGPTPSSCLINAGASSLCLPAFIRLCLPSRRATAYGLVSRPFPCFVRPCCRTYSSIRSPRSSSRNCCSGSRVRPSSPMYQEFPSSSRAAVTHDRVHRPLLCLQSVSYCRAVHLPQSNRCQTICRSSICPQSIFTCRSLFAAVQSLQTSFVTFSFAAQFISHVSQSIRRHSPCHSSQSIRRHMSFAAVHSSP